MCGILRFLPENILAKRHLLSSKILCGRMWSLKGRGEGFLTQVNHLFVHIFTSPPPLPFLYIFSITLEHSVCLSQHRLAGIRLFVAALLSLPSVRQYQPAITSSSALAFMYYCLPLRSAYISARETIILLFLPIFLHVFQYCLFSNSQS